MPRRPPPTIGTVNCPICGETGALRKSRDGKFYYICACGGAHYLEGASGQDFLDRYASVWETAPPAPSVNLNGRPQSNASDAESQNETVVDPEPNRNKYSRANLGRTFVVLAIFACLLGALGEGVISQVRTGARRD